MKSALFTGLMLVLFAVSVQAAGLRIISEISPPLNFTEDGTEKSKPLGQAVDIVQEIQKRLQDTTPIEFMPWARGYDLIQHEPDIMLFSTTRTEAREKMFQWVGPVGFNEWVFVAKKGSSLSIKSLDEAKKVANIGAYKNDVRELFLRDQGFTNIDSADNPLTLFKKIMAGRDDLWLTDTDEYRDVAKANNVDPSELVPLYVVKKTDLYLAFSLEAPAETVAKWQKTYDEIKADGTLAKIMAKWAK